MPHFSLQEFCGDKCWKKEFGLIFRNLVFVLLEAVLQHKEEDILLRKSSVFNHCLIDLAFE